MGMTSGSRKCSDPESLACTQLHPCPFGEALHNESGCTDFFQYLLGMRGVFRLNNYIQRCTLGRHIEEHALMRYFQDIGARIAQQTCNAAQHARSRPKQIEDQHRIAHVDPEFTAVAETVCGSRVAWESRRSV